MDKIQITNTQFEWELDQKNPVDFVSSFNIQPIFLQLQFLSYLYSDPSDTALTTHYPDPEYLSRLKSLGVTPPKTALISSKHLPDQEVDYWGAAPSLSQWCKRKNRKVQMPSAPCIKEVNSKAFSYIHSPQLEGSRLLRSYEEATNWIYNAQTPLVLKTVFGLSGRGHYHIKNGLDNKTCSFLHQIFNRGQILIGEPWMQRILDFSTQWIIDKEIGLTYLGCTVCHNDANGSYQKTTVYPNDSIGKEYNGFLEDHKRQAQITMQALVRQGFYGNVGIDAMIYMKNGQRSLQPIVEINARKTMGWVALTLQRRYFADQPIEMSYNTFEEGINLLPDYITDEFGQKINFNRVLRCSNLFSSNC